MLNAVDTNANRIPPDHKSNASAEMPSSKLGKQQIPKQFRRIITWDVNSSLIYVPQVHKINKKNCDLIAIICDLNIPNENTKEISRLVRNS